MVLVVCLYLLVICIWLFFRIPAVRFPALVLGHLCLFTLPTRLQSTLLVVPLKNVEKKVLERGVWSMMFTSLVIQSFVNSRKYRASRTKMKAWSLFIQVLVWGFSWLVFYASSGLCHVILMMEWGKLFISKYVGGLFWWTVGI